MKYVLLHVGDTLYPDAVNVPKSPYEWVDLTTKTEKGGSTFDIVYNLGGQSSFSYRFLFAYLAKGGQYKACCLPYGFHPVTSNEDDAVIRIHGG